MLKKNRVQSQNIKPFRSWPLLCLILLSLFCSVFIKVQARADNSRMSILVPKIEQAAQRYGIEDHMNELLAILKVESNNGQTEDVFQSSESMGLPPNSLSTDESIEQGCRYYAALLKKAADLNLDQDSVFQAYNYGSGYLDYVARHGGSHTRALAEQFSKEQCSGATVSYTNPIAIASNGGWRYDYGNMFYVDLIHQNL